MAANNDPIYTRLSDVQGSPTMSAANASVYDIAGTVGTDIYRVFTADATNGGFVQRVRFKYFSPTAATSVAATAKLWITSGSFNNYIAGVPSATSGTAWFYDEIALPATTALTATTTTAAYDVPFGFALPAGYGIVAKLTAAQPAGGWVTTAIAGKY
jgi:hypothetical protein